MLNQVRAIAREAGKATLEFFQGDFQVETKQDDSPLTCADRASHELIVQRLQELTPAIPVLSEESTPEEISERRGWKRFWLVDPLDGTKEFVKGTGEFTVNIALVEEGRSVLGVVHQPTQNLTYWAAKGQGAFRRCAMDPPTSITTRRARKETLALTLSVSHASEGMMRLLARHPEWSVRQAGSSLKFCLVAEGAVDVYPRMGPTMEWDTAAAQCVVEEAGGVLLDLEGNPFRYNKVSLRNPSLICLGDPQFDWQSLVAAAQEEG
jgi:3'(2'), 5'-bisphosphate nucleotidase